MSKTYTAIPGLGTGRTSFRIGVRDRIFQGPDHLLFIQNSGYTEDYRRVFYRDIRYVLIRKNNRSIWISFVTVALIVMICLFNFAGADWWALGIICAPFVIFLLINIFRGPSCDCYVATNVQLVPVAAPQRMSKVPLFLDFLKTKVPSL